MSVNVGALQLIPEGKSRTRTGIFKQPVQGPVAVGKLGLDGDKIANKKYHGGPDQAVYLYSAQDYEWWAGQLDRVLGYGAFGENVTLVDFGADGPHVGDVWHIGGEVILQLTAPRIPCSKLSARMGDPFFLKAFVAANRSGAYARVLQPGQVQAGDRATLASRWPDAPSLADIFRLLHQRDKDPAMVRRALASPLGERARDVVSKWSPG
jgi:MOSC domain-containing protein YiiM